MNRRSYLLLSLIAAAILVIGAAGLSVASAVERDSYANSDDPGLPASTTLDGKEAVITPSVFLPEVLGGMPVEQSWASSGHADADAIAFTYWDDADPPEVPETCAKCHSTPGFLDFLGQDGTAAGVVDNPAPIGSVIECEACHNASAEVLTTVTFPSGTQITGLGVEAPCLQCHQGRNSTVGVNAVIANAGVGNDEVSGSLSFLNSHYLAAGATQYGTKAKGAYEYAGQTYKGLNAHVPDYDTCIDCHETHGLGVLRGECSVCHEGVVTTGDLKKIRTSGGDFDGDGDETEGIAGEIETLRQALLPAIQDYANSTVGTGIVYARDFYPFYFTDLNSNGIADPPETVRDNGYAQWTPRLLRAAYNYHYLNADPGAYAHNGLYILQVLFDSLKDIGADVSGMTRP